MNIYFLRNNLQKLCYELFSKKENGFLFESTVTIYKLLFPDIQVRITNSVKLIYDMKMTNQSDTTYRCLQLTVSLLQDSDLKNLSPKIRSLAIDLVLPNVGSEDENLRGISTRALGLICIKDLGLAKKYFEVFLMMIEKDSMKIMLEAFKSTINCIMTFSLHRLLIPEKS